MLAARALLLIHFRCLAKRHMRRPAPSIAIKLRLHLAFNRSFRAGTDTAAGAAVKSWRCRLCSWGYPQCDCFTLAEAVIMVPLGK